MKKEPSWRRYLAFWRPSVDRDVDAEIRFHFDERVADLLARGRSEAEARAEAEQEFGDRTLYRDRLREIDDRMQARRNRAEWFDVLRGDLRLAWRGMRRAPALSAMVVVTLALGIGANGAIFSMLDRIFLRPPPGVANPDELIRIHGDYKAPPPSPGFVREVFGAEEVKTIRQVADSAFNLAGYRYDLVRLGYAEDSPMGVVIDTHGDYFGLLGVRPWKGRFFLPEERSLATPPRLVVLAHRFWQRHYGGDESVMGREVEITRQKYTVVGIAPPGFDGVDLDAADIWRLPNLSDPYYGPGSASIRLLARVKDADETRRLVKLADDAMHTKGDRISTNTTLLAVPIRAGRSISHDFKEGDIAKRLAGVTLIVLLIAVANVANLLLTRAIQRRRETAIRISLGVSRLRLAAQLITESALLALLAGCAALLVATWGASLMRNLLLPEVRWSDGPFDWRLGIYTIVIALGAGLLAGLMPFLRTGRLDLASSMRGGARDGATYRSRTRGALIIAQTALSVVLLVAAVTFVRSLNAIRSVDIGFDPADVVMAQIASGQAIIPVAERQAALLAIRERLAATPGVLSAATSNLEPMAGLSFSELHFPGRDSLPRSAAGPPTFVAVSPEYFRTLGVSVIAGRAFTEADRDGAPKVMIVTRTMARIAWGSANPIGQCVKVGKVTEPCTTVVGVIEDVRRDKVIEDEALLFYLPSAQAPAWARGASTLLVRAQPSAVESVRRQVRTAILSALPASRPEVTTFAEQLDPQYRPWRVGASLFSAFGLLALLVAAIGMYSAISYAVTQRSHELGVRMALGAQRSQIGGSVVKSGVRLVCGGVVAGIVTAVAMSRLIESLLYGTSARDPFILIGVGVMLVGVAVIAAGLPAWRATRLDPVGALRSE